VSLSLYVLTVAEKERALSVYTPYLDSVNVGQSITCSMTDENNWVSEGHRRRNWPECRSLVQSTGRYHTHL